MKRKILNAIFFLVFVVGVYYFFLRSPLRNAGKDSPEITADLIDGSTFQLSELKGHYVLLDFWGSWCGPCRKDMPNVIKLHNEFNGQSFNDATDFQVVSVALEKNDKTWKKAAESMGMNWRYQIVEVAKVILLSPLAQKFAVHDLPTKFLIGPEGNVLGVNQSYAEIRAYLQSKQ